MRKRKLLIIFVVIFGLLLGRNVWAGVSINMDTIRMKESSGNRLAYNKKSGACGLYQITAIVLLEYNQFHKVDYTKQDLFNADINFRIADWYMNVRIPQLLKHFKQADTVRNRLIAYNAGIKHVIDGQLKKETLDYIVYYTKKQK